MLSIAEISFQNLRGYNTATLPLEKDHITIVGDNNQGKSSALLLLDFMLNLADKDVLTGVRRLNDNECDLLLPANDARHQARRLSLRINFGDRRTRRRYLIPGEDQVVLRLSVHREDRKLRLNLGRPRMSESSVPKAFELLEKVRANNRFLLIPSDRSPASAWFKKIFTEELTTHLQARMRHRGPGGSTRDYRAVLFAVKELKRLGDQFGLPLWSAMHDVLPPALVRSGKLNFPATNDAAIEWLKTMAELRLSTGRHDANSVGVGQVGTGLQSLIGIALGIHSISRMNGAHRIVAVEEPEENLHPSAQRAAAVLLRKTAARAGYKVIITTHSPYFLEEAKYGETIIVRGRRYYKPEHVGARRSEINTAFMNVSSAEIFFSNRVLFVEGPGDKAVFETLIRRLRMIDGAEHLWGVAVQDVGGKNSYAPWIQLLRCYGQTGDRPIRWKMLFDADAASSALTRCLQDAGYILRPTVAPQCQRLIHLATTSPLRQREADRLNRMIFNFRARLFSVDLEWAIVNASGAKQTRILDLWNKIIADEGATPLATPLEMATKLGSKVGAGNGLKQPHLRFKFAQRVHFADLPDELESALLAILHRFYSRHYGAELLVRARRLNPTLV